VNPDPIHLLQGIALALVARVKLSLRMVREACDHLYLVAGPDPGLGHFIDAGRRGPNLRRKIMRQVDNFHKQL
jgi:hypothetical protein